MKSDVKKGVSMTIPDGWQRYRPSNGTAGEAFMEIWCYNCVLDNLDDDGFGGCEIIARAMALDIGHPDYPDAWIINNQGEAKCTAFTDKVIKVG
jgi:hypothetical protein